MGCDEACEWLLEAGPDELELPPVGIRDHLDACPLCAARLDQVAAGALALSGDLARRAPPFSEDAAVRLATGRRGAGAGTSGSWRRARSWRAGSRLRAAAPRWGRWALPAAALVLALFLGLPGPPVSPDPEAAFGPAPDAADRHAFSVEAAGNGRVAVFQTGNPRIRVVWLY